MNRRRFIGALAATGTAVLAGCSGGGGGDGSGNGNGNGGGGTTTTTERTPTTVNIKGSAFNPIRLKVEPGATVTWENEDTYPHTVNSAQFHEKAADWSMSERISASGGSTEHTFEKAGVYEYYCRIHGKSTMCGVILVGDVSLDAKLPCEQ